MHNSPLGGHILSVRPSLRTLIDLSARPAEPDAALLRLFASNGDPVAFAELVRRYGRLVWGQCKNLLASEADADDAFQATFLTLAKSAKSVKDANKLGPWLHGVAYCVCQNSKRKAARRAKREKATAKREASKPVADSAWDAAFAAVHDELAKLPDTLRVPFVLCVLEGKGTSEAAAQLGLKLGTFSARLSRAKQALFERLSARGLTTGLAVVGAVAVGAANVPAAVAGRACDLAAGGAVAPNILSLTHGVLTMTATTLKRWAMAAVLATALTAGVGGVMTASAEDKKADPKPKPGEQAMKDAEERFKQAQVEVERARARTEALRLEEVVREREAKDKQPEFKYDVKGAEYAPTTTEFEKAVKDGEEGGYSLVGVVTFAGFTEKKGKGPVQALVFRRAVAKEWRVAEIELEKRKPQARVAEVEIDLSAEEKKLRAEIVRLTKELDELKAKAKPLPPDADFRGEVAAVDEKSGVVMFSGGANAGVKSGARYVITRKVAPFYVGTVYVIDASDPKQSVGIFTPAAGNKLAGDYIPKKGDEVSAR